MNRLNGWLLPWVLMWEASYAGGPPPNMKQEWIQDTVQFAQSHSINLGDLGKEILLSLANEIGVWKIISILLLFLLLSAFGVVWGALKLLRKGKG